MSAPSICSTCLRGLRTQTQRQLQHQQPSRLLSSTPSRALHNTARRTADNPTSSQAPKTTPESEQSGSAKAQANFINSLRNTEALRSTTEPYVAYGATEDLFKSCASTCSYTIPSATASPPEPAPKNARGEDVGEGSGWWFQPKSKGGLELPVTFNMWAQVMYLHMYALTVRLRRFPAKHVRIWEQNLLDHFFYAAEDRMAMWHGMAARGVRNKHLKDLWLQWRGVLVSYDEGLIKGDAVLGAAVWRNVFQAREDVDIADIATVVSYLRREIARLDKLPDAHLTTGQIKFPSPQEEVQRAAQTSSWMQKPFTEGDLAPLQQKKAA